MIALYKKLKFWIEDEEFDSTLGFDPEDFSEDQVCIFVELPR